MPKMPSQINRQQTHKTLRRGKTIHLKLRTVRQVEELAAKVSCFKKKVSAPVCTAMREFWLSREQTTWQDNFIQSDTKGFQGNRSHEESCHGLQWQARTFCSKQHTKTDFPMKTLGTKARSFLPLAKF